MKYAQERYITIIPEVDLPGHMLAALAAYPEMGCTGGPYEVCPRWGVFEDVLCIGNDKTMQFLEDVMSEIIEIFPSEYVHIGGDEAPRTRWENVRNARHVSKRKG
ncbi:MAG: family 20 glycosylhydrolase [Bacteroides cellulosilyticus]